MSIEFKPENPWVTWTELHGGVTQVYALCKNWHCPIAFVWGLHTGGDAHRFEVLHSYTLPFVRRFGLRTLINDEVFKKVGVDVIISGKGTDTGGMAFMKSYGYVKHPPTGNWYVTKKMRERKKKRNEDKARDV